MKTTKRMRQVITAIAARHAFDLSVPDQSLVLHNDPYTRLVIGVEADHLISVAHRALPAPGEDPISDPDILFWTGGDGWVPLEVTFATGVYQQVAFLEKGRITGWYPRLLRETIDLANLWARNLRAQGWLKEAVRDE